VRVFNDGELDAVERFIAPDHVNHDPTAPEVPPGPQGVRMLARHPREAFPDIEYTIEEIFSSGDRVAHRWTFTGTHEAELMGIEPTGRRVEVTGI
jgi:predicted ester cyclase